MTELINDGIHIQLIHRHNSSGITGSHLRIRANRRHVQITRDTQVVWRSRSAQCHVCLTHLKDILQRDLLGKS